MRALPVRAAHRRVPLLTLALALAALGCDGRAIPTLRLTGVAPSQGDDDAAIELEITGDHFLPRTVSDFDHRGQSTVDDSFAAFLVPTDPSLPEVPLLEVRRVSQTTLGAKVPAGPARGFYGLRLVDPFGNTASLPEVYRVVHSERTLAGFRFERLGSQRAGVPFMLQVSAVDAAGDLVDGFSGAVTLQDRSAALTPGQLGPFTLGRARGLVVVGSIIGADAIEASDGQGHTGRSNEFVVLPGITVQLALGTTPATLDAGACSGRLDVLLQDTAGRPTPSASELTVALEASPPDRFALFSDPACTVPAEALSIALHAPSTTFSVQARRAGTLVLRATAPGLPATTRTLTVAPLAASRIDFASPSQTLAVGACSDAVRVGTFDAYDNAAAPVAALTVELRSQPTGALAFFSDEACTAPLTSVPLGPGAPEAGFHVRAGTPGTGYVRASVAGSPLTPGLLALEVTP